MKLSPEVTVQVVGQASRLPHRASRPGCLLRGREALPTGATPAPLPKQLRPRSEGQGAKGEIGMGRIGNPGSERGYLLAECLVYLSVVFVLLGSGYVALYRCMDNSVALRRSADDIADALHAGERWRADVRSAAGQVRLEKTSTDQIILLSNPRGEVGYRFSSGVLYRRMGPGPWAPLLTSVKSSVMEPDPRQNVTAWRWELELQPRGKGSAKPGRFRPLFTFIAATRESSIK